MTAPIDGIGGFVMTLVVAVIRVVVVPHPGVAITRVATGRRRHN